MWKASRSGLAVALLCALAGWLWDPVPQVMRTLIVELTGPASDACEIFYSSDGAFTAEKRISQPYGSRATLSFALPPDAVFLRLDPGGNAGTYVVHALTLAVGDGPFSNTQTWTGAQLAASIHDATGASVHVKGSDLIVESAGADPYFTLGITWPAWPRLLSSIPRIVFGFLVGGFFGLLGFWRLRSTTHAPEADRVLRWIFGVMMVGVAAPFLWTRFPPLIDAGLHAGAAAVWHHFTDPTWHFGEYYDLSVGPVPYAGYYGAIHLLAYLVGVEPAARLLVFVAAIGLPLVALLLLRELKLPIGGSVLVGAFVYSMSFNSGFIAFCLGTNLAIAGWIVFLRALSTGRALAWMASLLIGVACFFFHILAWGIWGAGLLVFGLLALREHGLRRVLLVWSTVIPATIIAAVVTSRGSGLNMGNVEGLLFKQFDWRFDLSTFFEWIWDACANDASQIVGAVFTAVVLLLALSGLRQLRGAQRGLPLLAAFFLLCYLAMPFSVVAPAYWWGINIRFAMPATLLAALSIGALEGTVRRTLFAACVLLAGWLLVDANRHWYGTRQTALAFEQLSKIPKDGDRVFFLMHLPHSDAHYKVRYKRYTLAGYYQAMRGGFLAWNFDDGFPLRYKTRFPGAPFNIPNFRWDRHARYYDWVLDYGGNGSDFAGHESEMKRVGEGAGFILWKLPGPRDDVPPHPPYPSAKSFF